MDLSLTGWIVAIGVPLAYTLGGLSALDALLKTRTAQGATAWILALLLMPFVALPLYWVFGRTRFDGYGHALRAFDAEADPRIQIARTSGRLADLIVHAHEASDERTRGELRGFENLSTLPFTRGNSARLLIDGAQTFSAIFDAIDAADDYVLAQFYIIHDDGVGNAFKERLLAAAARGVRVYLLYDEIGSARLPRRYSLELRAGGVEVSGFGGARSLLGRFRLNFRNHRKIVVVDGRVAFAGGLNVGDEYMGRDPKLHPWRDTHLALTGPAALGLQFSFARDWFYSRGQTLALRWEPVACGEDQQALVLASGPADPIETCGLLFTHAIESAERRVWIATPYFVPDARVLGALQLAALRGVDVRVLMPRKSDSLLFRFVPYAYLPEAESAGVRVFVQDEGFMHQKVLLVDDDYAAVGTANLDNRSFRLNFEVTCLVRDAGFCGEVAAMLEADFAGASRLTGEDFERRGLPFHLAVQTTRLLAPVL